MSDGAITVTVTDTLQLTNEQKAADGGKSALTEAAKTAGDEVKKELNKLAEKLDALRGDKSRKNAQLEKVVDVTVALVKTEGNEIKTVAQLIGAAPQRHRDHPHHRRAVRGPSGQARLRGAQPHG